MIKLCIQQGPFEIEYNYQEADPGMCYGPPENCWEPSSPEVEIVKAYWVSSEADLKDYFGDDFPRDLLHKRKEVPKDVLDSWLESGHNEENFITEALDHGEDIEYQDDPRDP